MVAELLLATLLAVHQAAALAPQLAAAGIHLPGSASAPPVDGEITSMPGYVGGPLKSRHFGGYVQVDAAANRNLYYYMVESEHDPATDPVVLWLNGGPGCSSFDGFVYELGPFSFSFADASALSQVVLRDNPHRWNAAATMVFLDSPSAVGLSYSDEPADYTTNDTATAADAHTFLRIFLQRYPHLQHNDFYVAGESYAGVYVPMLTREVVRGNAAGVQPHINIKGYLVGNGVTDPVYDGNALPPFAVGKSLIPAALFRQLSAACHGRFDDTPDRRPPRSRRCEQLLGQVGDALSHLNIYNILEECHHKPHTNASAALVHETQRRLTELLRSHRTWPVTGVVHQHSRVQNWQQLLGHNPPCTDASEAEAWLNDPVVREALHAAPVSVTGTRWMLCSDRLVYTADGGSMLPIHKELTTKHGLRALIYSGDHDACVPHTGSEAWTAALHREHRRGEEDGADDASADEGASAPPAAWLAWFNSERPPQVAGYVVAYKSGLTYATIKGAGHMVPQTRPREALDMFRRFVHGQPLTSDA